MLDTENAQPNPEEARIAAELDAYEKEPVNIDLGPAYAKHKAIQDKEMAARELEEGEGIKTEDIPLETDEKEQSAEDIEAKAETEGRARDAQGKFIKKEASEDDKDVKDDVRADQPDAKTAEVNVEKAGEGKPADTTAYEKAKKEAARKEKTWQQLEADKAKVRADEARLEAERKTFERLVEARTAQVRPRDAMGNEIYTAQEYLNAAKNFRKDGEHEMADKAEAAYEHAKTEEAKAAQQRFNDHQKDMALKVMDAEPELANQQSPLALELQSVFNEEFERSKQYQRQSIFQSTLDGFGMAVEFSKLRMKAKTSEKLATELKDARAEIQRLNSLTNVTGSGPTKPGRSKSFEEMTSDEQLAYMDRQVRDAGYNFSIPQR